MLERSLPADPIVRKHDRGIESGTVQLEEASLRVGIARCELFEVEFGRQAVHQALSKCPDPVDISGTVWSSKAEATVAEHQPGVAEVVGGHMQGYIPISRVDVLPPHSGWFEEMGVRVDQQTHAASPFPRCKALVN
jgi:hypothetical protein